MNYDIHIYWRNNDERNEALALQKILTGNNVQTFPFVEKAIGPHPYPMFESHLTNQTLPVIESLLVANRKSRSILIHEKLVTMFMTIQKGPAF